MMEEYGHLQLAVRSASIKASKPYQISASFELTIVGSPDGSRKVLQYNECTPNIYRKSAEAEFINKVVSWSEVIEVRCLPSWEAFVVLLVRYSDGAVGEEFTLTAEPFSLSHTKSQHKLALTEQSKRNTSYGELFVETEFLPNHQSFRCLCVEFLSEPEISKRDFFATQSLLINDLISVLETSAVIDLMTIGVNSLFKNAVMVLKSELVDHMSTGGLAKKLADKMTPAGVNSSRITKAINNYADTNSTFELTRIPSYKVTAAVRSYILSLNLNLPNCPELSTELIEKQLSIFMATSRVLTSSSIDGGTEVLSNGSDGNSVPSNSLNASFTSPNYSLHSPSQAQYGSSPSASPFRFSPSTNTHISLQQCVGFCQIACVWLLQNAFLASTLCAEFKISPQELAAIRKAFSEYDLNLSGEIPSAEVSYLLEDMGGAYSDDELRVILEDLDPDYLGSVEFADFICWWCIGGPDDIVCGEEAAVANSI